MVNLSSKLLAFLLCAAPISELAAADHNYVYWQFGDESLWSEPAFDHSAWHHGLIYEVPRADPILWIRQEIELPTEHQQAGESLSVIISALAAYEVFWDGHLLGSNGMVGSTQDSEHPGQLQAEFYVPEALRQGPSHVIAIRASTWHTGFQPSVGFYALDVGPYTGATRSMRWQLLVPVFTMGGFLMSALFFLILFVSNTSRHAYLLLASFSLVTAAMLLAEAWRPLFGYTYDWHVMRLRLILGLAAASGLLINLFLISQFRLAIGRTWPWLTLAASLLSAYWLPGYDHKTMAVLYLFYTLALVLGVIAWRGRSQGSGFALAGIAVAIVFMLFAPFSFLDLGVYLASSILLAALITATVLYFKHQEQQHRELIQQTEQLRQQLIQQHLQPHFLMNTLTALQEWIESDPAAGSKLIDSLADLYHDLNRTSEQDLIPLEQEIALCEKYLAVMEFRQNHQFQLQVAGPTSDLQLPPGIVLTWLENAITHNRYSDSPTRFQLDVSQRSDVVEYRLATPLTESSQRSGTGMGTRYVLARMQRAFGNRFQVDGKASGNHWVSVIQVPA